MKKVLSFLMALGLLSSASAAASVPPTSAEYGYKEIKNIISNPGAEQAKTGWKITGTGTFQVDSNPANAADGAASFMLSGMVSTSLWSSLLTPLPNGSQNCAARFKYNGGDANYTAQVVDSSANILTSQVLAAQTVYTPTLLTFPCVSGGVKVQLLATGSAATVHVDDVFLGDAYMIGQLSQAKLIGGVTITNCAGSWTSTAASFASFSPTSGCTYTPFGLATGPATQIPAVSFSSLLPGEYKIDFVGVINDVTNDLALRFWDGTNPSREQSHYASGASTNWPDAANHSINYSTTQSNVTLEMQAMLLSGGTGSINCTSGFPCVLKVYYFPNSNQNALTPQTSGWKLDVNVNGSNPALPGAVTVSYQTVPEATLNLQVNPGSISAQIPCNGGNPSTGVTCATGTPEVGVVFNVPAPQSVYFCIDFTQNTSVSGGGGTQDTWSLFETTNTAETPISGGLANLTQTSTGAAINFSIPFHVCETFNFASAGQKTVRLFQAHVGGASITSSFITDQAIGNRNAHISAFPIVQNLPAPLLVNSVISSSAGVERIERARVLTSAPCSSDPCTIESSSGGISAINRVGTGAYIVHFNPPFASPPVCHADTDTFVPGTSLFCISFPASATPSLIDVNCFNLSATGSATFDGDISITCQGPR